MSMGDLEARFAALEAQLEAERERQVRAEFEIAAARKEVDNLVQEQRLGRVKEEPGVAEAPTYQPPIYVTPTRKFDRLRGRPEKSGDPEVAEWIGDIRCHLTAKHITGTAACALIKENLKGRARLEIEGRGINDDPEAIFRALLEAFGDGGDLAALQERLFQYRQSPGETVVDCSLKLVEIYNKVAEKDPAYESRRDQTLKERLAASVADQSLSREIRRLIQDAPGLNFFELRNRAVEWAGGDKPKEGGSASSQEMTMAKDSLVEAIERQNKLMERRMDALESALKQQNPSGGGRFQRYRSGPRLCWKCQSPDHIQWDCPEKKEVPPSNPPSETPF